MSDRPEKTDIEKLRMTVAQLESRIDQLESELAYLNKMLIQVGFEQGINDLKGAIGEVLEDEQEKPPEDKDET
jgi:prefoldin subunit 5